MPPLAWFSLGLLAPVLLVALVGATRLLWSRKAQYPDPITDPAVLNKGDILLVGKQRIGDSWYIQLANVLTRKLKHRFWTHAAIYQGNGRVWEAQPAPLGVSERDLRFYLDGGYYLRAFRHKYIRDEQALDRVIAFCASKQGDGYDLWGAVFYGLSILIPVGFNFLFDNAAVAKFFHVDNNYFCSELVVEAFEAAQYPISPFDGWRVKPSDFISNPVLDEVGRS